ALRPAHLRVPRGYAGAPMADASSPAREAAALRETLDAVEETTLLVRPDGSIQHGNRAARELFQRGSTELVGVHVFELFSAPWRDSHDWASATAELADKRVRRGEGSVSLANGRTLEV